MKKILAIDDQQGNLTTIKAVLKVHLQDCKVLTALSGKEGIEIARKEQPDTILLDIIMPEMDGYEVCKRLKDDKLTKHIPIIMITAIKTDTKSRVKGLNLGADAFLSKPIDAIELSVQVNVMLRIKEVEDKLRDDKENLEELVTKRTFELKESQEKYKALYENTPLSYQSLNEDGSIRDVNLAWLKTLGYKQEEVIGKWFGELLHPDWKAHFEKNFSEFKQSGYHHNNQFKIRHKDGHYIDILSEGCIGFNPDGSFKQTYCVFQDITERKLTEEALISSEERLKIIFESAPDAYYLSDLKGNFLDGNKAAEEMIGLKKEDLIGKSFLSLKLLNIKDVPKATKALAKNVMGKKTGPDEFLLNRKDGIKIPVEISTYPVKIKNKTVVLGIARDITERNQAEKLLKESEEKFKSITERIYDIILTADLQGNIIYVSPSVFRVFGYPPDDLIGKNITEFVPKEEIPNVIETFKLSASGKNIENYYSRFLKKDGSLAMITLSAVPITENNKIVGAQAIIRDVTERMKIEQALKENEQMLRESQKAASIGSYVMDLSSSIWKSSTVLDEIFGIKEDFNKNMAGWLQIVHPKDQAMMQDYFTKNILTNHENFNKEYRIIRIIDQTERWVHGMGELEFDKDGNPVKMIGVIQDITERKQIEEALRISEEKYSLMIQNSPDLTILQDPDGKVTYISPQSEKVLGHKAEEFIGMGFPKYVHPKDKRKALKAMISSLEGNDIANFEYRFIGSDKTIHWLSYSARPIKKGNKIIAILSTVSNITEKKKLQLAVKDNEERLSLLIQQSPSVIELYDLNGLQIEVNKAYEELWGFPASQTVNKFNVLKSKEVESTGLMKYIKRAYAGESVQVPEYKFDPSGDTEAKGKGRTRWLSTHIYPLKDSAGDVKNIVITHEDITKVKESDRLIKQSEDKYRIMIETSNDMIWMLDANGNFTFFNKQVEETTGYLFKDWEGKSFIPLIFEEELPFLQNVFIKTMSGESFTYEFKLKITNGKVLTIAVNTAPIYINNKITGMISFGRDITLQKEAERELIESETRFKALHNASFGGIAIHDMGVIKECNQGLSTMTGYSTEELIGMDGFLLIAEDSREMVMNNIKASYDKPYEVIGLRKNGAKYTLRLEARMIPYKGKELSVVEFRDITEQKVVEQKLLSALEKATESDRLKSAFLATMSHELRTPLNAIIGFSGIINEDLSKEETISFAKTINSSGNHLLSIVEDLFDITLIEAGEIKIQKQEENLHSILKDINEIIKTEQQIIHKSNLDLNLIIPVENTHLTINTDPSKFKQILINLLKNALKFTDDGQINYGYKIVTYKDKQMLKFYVEDTGIGISKDKQSFIFDIFRQADDSHTRNYGGTGIGLSISKKLVGLLGGKIWLESEEGKGSTFYFTIPLIQGEQIVKQTIEIDNHKNNFIGKIILIVEDDESSYEFLKVIITKSGINTIWAKDGEEAIKFCEENANIDLILMDINMPVMNGYEATKLIKKIKPHLPIIAQTAYAIIGDRQKSIDAGCDDYISKPIKKQELIAKIGKLLSS